MTVRRLQSQRVLVVGEQGGWTISYWIDVLRSLGADVHFFPLDWAREHFELHDVTVHHLFPPLRPRLMLKLAKNAPDQLFQFPNYEAHLRKPYRTEFIYPLPLLELPGHPAAPISKFFRKTGFVSDIRPAALARVVRRVRPDLLLSVGLDPAASVTLRARDRFGPGFPTWLAYAWNARGAT